MRKLSNKELQTAIDSIFAILPTVRDFYDDPAYQKQVDHYYALLEEQLSRAVTDR